MFDLGALIGPQSALKFSLAGHSAQDQTHGQAEGQQPLFKDRSDFKVLAAAAALSTAQPCLMPPL